MDSVVKVNVVSFDKYVPFFRSRSSRWTEQMSRRRRLLIASADLKHTGGKGRDIVATHESERGKVFKTVLKNATGRSMPLLCCSRLIELAKGRLIVNEL